MNWRNILKDDDDDKRKIKLGDRFQKPDGSVFIDGYGFKQKPFRRDKQSIIRDKDGNIRENVADFREENPDKPLPDEIRLQKVGLVNWFRTIMNTFDEYLGKVGAFGQTSVNLDPENPGFARVDKKKSKASKNIQSIGMEIAMNNIEGMLEGYLTSLTKNNKNFDDSERSIQGIMGSSGYNRMVDAGLKFTEEMMSAIFDASYTKQQHLFDKESYSEDEDEEDDEEIDFMDDPPQSFIEDQWTSLGSRIEKDVKNLINNVDEYLDDVINDAEESIFDLDGDGKTDINNNEIRRNVKNNLQKVYASSEMTELVKKFTGNVGFAFQVRLVQFQESVESNPEVSDQLTEQQAQEMRDRPQVQVGEMTDEERRKFEEEFKSNDQYTGEFGWRDLLSKRAGTGMTTNAGFRPAEANIMYGEKPPCKKCNDKTTPCGCGK
tara:strand:+ start:5103 stop:6404 length:1302 start_codon:yes stop_codon:yes gene_type:complete